MMYSNFLHVNDLLHDETFGLGDDSDTFEWLLNAINDFHDKFFVLLPCLGRAGLLLLGGSLIAGLDSCLGRMVSDLDIHIAS